MPAVPEVLVVEDDATTQMLLIAVIRRLGYRATVAGDGAAAMALLAARLFDAIVLDLILPKVSGFDLLRHLESTSPAMMKRIIVLTAAPDVTTRDCAQLKQIAAFLRKPVDIDVLATTIYACTSASVAMEAIPTEMRAGGPGTTIRR